MAKKALLCILLSVTVLMVAGIAALGYPSQNGVITLNGGRSTVVLNGPLGQAQTKALERFAGLVVVYNNFGAENTYDCCEGWTASGNQSRVGANIISACAFTPNANYAVAGIKIAVSYVEGVNGTIISLNADDGGLPGKVLHAWSVSNLPTFGTCCTVEQLRGSRALPISSGMQYWVVVRPVALDNWDSWNLNNNHAVGNFAQKYNGTWTPSHENTLGAFAVYGEPMN